MTTFSDTPPVQAVPRAGLVGPRRSPENRGEFHNPVPVPGRPGQVGGAPVLDVVVPVFNEEVDLEPCVRRLHRHLSAHMPYSFRITVADNASTDATAEIAQRLAAEFPEVGVARLDQKGRGRALRQVWAASDAAVLVYMDVDLSTDLAALLPLIAPLVSGHSDLAIGSRLHRGSRVIRGAKREFISRSYNVVLRATVRARFSDAQCGFKAIRADAAAALLPHVQDNAWFFDTELLVLAERAGMRIHEIPVDWVDDPGSTVHIRSTAMQDLRGIARLLVSFARGRLPVRHLAEQLGRSHAPCDVAAQAGLLRQLVRFGAVGLLSTFAYAVLYLLLRPSMGAQGANAFTLLLTTVGNTALNRRFTFGIAGRARRARQQLQGLVVLGVTLTMTSGALGVTHAVHPDPGHQAELLVLIGANGAAILVRFLMLRRWVFGR